MPIYEYVCEKCGNLIEVMQKVNDEPLKRCTKCRGKLEKIFSRTSFQLKGSGWYKSDYSSSGAKPKTKEDKTKEEKKPEAKAETSSSSTTGSGGSGSGGSGKSD
jgi:putative FmdB family regulatory protein